MKALVLLFARRKRCESSSLDPVYPLDDPNQDRQRR
jgi:hypothetical protein